MPQHSLTMTTIRKATITEVSVRKSSEMDTEAQLAFKDIVKTGLVLKTAMKALHPILVRLKLIDGEETHAQIEENQELKLLLLANLAAQLPDRVSATGYGQGMISLFDLYTNKTEDKLIAFFAGKRINLNEQQLSAIKTDGLNLYQWLRRLRDETINSWDLPGKPSKAASRAAAAASKKAAVEQAVNALVQKRTAEQMALDELEDDANDEEGGDGETLSDVTGTVGEANKKRKKEKGIIKMLIDNFPSIEQGIFLVVKSNHLYCAPPDVLSNMYAIIDGCDDLELFDGDSE